MAVTNTGAVPNPRPWARGAVAAPPRALPLPFGRTWKVLIPHDVELSHLGRYMTIAALAGLCAMLSAWSRIDLRETAVALDSAERHYDAAQAQNARLQLELATLKDPSRLSRAEANVSLDRTVKVVSVPPMQKPKPPAAPDIASR